MAVALVGSLLPLWAAGYKPGSWNLGMVKCLQAPSHGTHTGHLPQPKYQYPPKQSLCQTLSGNKIPSWILFLHPLWHVKLKTGHLRFPNKAVCSSAGTPRRMLKSGLTGPSISSWGSTVRYFPDWVIRDNSTFASRIRPPATSFSGGMRLASAFGRMEAGLRSTLKPQSWALRL